MPKIIDTTSDKYDLIEGSPYTDYNAWEEFNYQLNVHFPGMFHTQLVSKRGNGTRIDVLLKCNFVKEREKQDFFYVYVFILYNGGNGRSEDELRTQLYPGRRWNPSLEKTKIATTFRDNSDIDLTNKECYCVGIYKQSENNHNVLFVGIPAEHLSKSETENISPTSTFQTYGNYVKEAYINGICLQPKHFNSSNTDNNILFRPEYLLWYMKNRDKIHIGDIDEAMTIIKEAPIIKHPKIIDLHDLGSEDFDYFTALQTKPFMLLAGISGTGKSRIVREFAFKSCPSFLRDQDETTPGNYCMIEVKPNWHDSTELLGYWSNINHQYVFPKFVRFLVKAKMYPDVPFFVCLDEMNLAPVEQYFAEILSILETRRHPKDNNTIRTGAIIESKYFEKGILMSNDQKEEVKVDRDGWWYTEFKCYTTSQNGDNKYKKQTEYFDKVENDRDLIENGLTLPDNVFIIGTVNMDDTTHQFSRKVIDRAMTIEMNGGRLVDMFGNDTQLSYPTSDKELIKIDDIKAKYVSADEVIANCTAIKANKEYRQWIIGKDDDGNVIEDSLPYKLEVINRVLKGTPFTVSYRVMNELVILVAVILDKITEQGKELNDSVFKSTLDYALDRILLMKILPRIEGDDDMFVVSDEEQKVNNLPANARDDSNYEYTKLDWLKDVCPQRKNKPASLEGNGDNEQRETQSVPEEYQDKYMAIDKLQEMIARLRRQNFTRFWP